MTTWSTRRTSLDPVEDWEHLDRLLRGALDEVTVEVLPDGPDLVVDQRLTEPGLLTLVSRPTALRAQDRRRLHRLGLRADGDVGDWTWRPPRSAVPFPRDLFAVLGLAGASNAALRDKAVAVLRDGLLLTPDRLRVVLLEEKGEEDDDPWDDDPWDDE